MPSLSRTSLVQASRAYLPSVPLLCIQMSKLYGDSTILKSVRNIGIDLFTIQNSITENSPIISRFTRLFFVRKISIISGIDPGGPTHFCIYHVRIWHSCNLNALNRSRKLRGGGDVSQKRCSNQLLFRTKCREPPPAPVSMKDTLHPGRDTYRAKKKDWFVVARYFFMVLLSFSGWPCLAVA